MEFTHTIGHQKQKEFFRRVYENGRLAHAYALCGPEHAGKTTFARELAGLLGADPILDVVVSDSEAGLSIEEARDMQSRLNRTAVRKLKVAIVAHAEKMGLAAANSILKLLEEPPAHSLLLLLTSNFHMLLPTVASRLQRVNFGFAVPADMTAALSSEKLEDPRFSQILKNSGGRIGIAKRLAREEEFYNFLSAVQEHYETLQSGSLTSRLQAAQTIALFPDWQQEEFLKFSMHEWAREAKPAGLGRKLLTSWQDMRFNVNSKLIFDYLFLP